MKSKHFYNFWDYFFFKKTVWDLVWNFDRPAKFLSGKCANFCSNSKNNDENFQKQKNFVSEKVNGLQLQKMKFSQTSKYFPLKLRRWYEEIFLPKKSLPLKFFWTRGMKFSPPCRSFSARRSNNFWPQSKNNFGL